MGEASWLSSFKQQRGSWGLVVLALLALVLALWCLANLLLLSAAVNTPDSPLSQDRIWIIFLLNVVFSLTFAASAYGLWTRRNWGRWLFIGSITIWVGFYVVSLFTLDSAAADGNYTMASVLINALIYIGGGGCAIWYLNLAHIKALFNLHPPGSTNEQINK